MLWRVHPRTKIEMSPQPKQRLGHDSKRQLISNGNRSLLIGHLIIKKMVGLSLLIYIFLIYNYSLERLLKHYNVNPATHMRI